MDRVNPVVKLMALVVGAVMVFLIDSPLMLLFFVMILLLMKYIYDIKGRFGRAVLGMVIAIFAAQVIFVPEGDLLLEFWRLEITTGSMVNGFNISGRFFSLITMSWIFVGTTEPRDLSAGLVASGVPYRYGFLLILSMRFAKVFQFELSNVQDAQKVRGLRVDSSIRGLISSVRYTTLPLLYSAMSKVNTLASSMEGRGFGMYDKKTFLRPVRFTPWDLYLVLLLLIVSAQLYYLNLLF